MPEVNIRENIARQYRASLAMLGQAIEECPDALWSSTKYASPYWHVAYHALFYAHLYLQTTEADFRAWDKHRKGLQYLGHRPGADEDAPVNSTPCSKAEILEYHALCRAEVEAKVPVIELDAPSGFYWLPFNKLEVQFYNIRHLQHHIGQLADRLRTEVNIGLRWVRPE